MKYIVFFFFNIMLAMSPLVVLAQERVLTLQACVEKALQSNLQLKAGQLAVEKNRALQGTAYALDQATLSLSQDPSSGGSPDNALTLSQTFDLPQVYAARRRHLKAETKESQQALAMTCNEVLKSVWSNYYTLLYLRRNVVILQQQDSVYRHFVELAQKKRKAGEEGQLAQINAERLYNENRIEKDKAERMYRSAQFDFSVLLNSDTLVTPADKDLSLLEKSISETELDFSLTPTGEWYAAQLENSARNLQLMQRSYLPKVTVGLRTQLLIKGFNPYRIERNAFDKGNFMGFEVGVSLPLFWGGQQAKVSAARREMELAEVNRQQAAQRQEKVYQDYRNEYSRAQKVLNYYTDAGLQQAERLRLLSEVSYKNGEIGYVEFIQNQKSALEVLLQYAKAVNDYNQSIIMLNYIKGNQ